MILKKSIALMVVSMIIISLLSGCGSDSSIIEQTKQPFKIQTLNLYNSDNLWYITKSSKVQWASEILVSSMVSGRIKDIIYGLGKQVSAWTLLVQLQDSTAPAGKAIKDAELALERAQLTKSFTDQDIQKQQEKISYDLNNVSSRYTGSSSQLQIEKLEQDLAKADFDYQTRLKSDLQTSQNFLTNIQNTQSDLKILLAETINETDKVLWITDKYINDANYRDMRVYLWAKKPETRSKTVDIFYDLQIMFDQLALMDRKDIKLETIDQILSIYQKIVLRMGDHFVGMKEIFIYSIEDARYQPQINTSSALFTSLQNRASGLNASITTQINSSKLYFTTYTDNQNSAAQQIDILKSQIDLAKKNLRDAEFNTIIWSDRSKIWFTNQIRNVDLNVQSSLLQLTQANFNQSKFSITSPLQWFIADVLVDFWQEVWPWTPLVKIISTQQQIDTTLTSEEIKNITLWQKVIVSSEVWEWKWVIAQIAATTDKSWSFKVIIILDDSTIPTWLFVTIKIPVQQWTLLLPLNALSIVDTNTAIAYFWDWSEIIPTTLTISSIFGDQVEITDQLPTNYELIFTDLSNYDERTMEIVKDWTLKVK